MANLIPKILVLSGFVLLSAPAPTGAQCLTPPVDINGRWTGNDGGIYYVRTAGRDGHDVWWVGWSNDGGKSWTHAFKGTKSGSSIYGEWADVRGNRGSGILRLQVTAPDTMVLSSKGGSPFGGRRWTRPKPPQRNSGCPDTQGGPADG